jgi:hypothetical protein
MARQNGYKRDYSNMPKIKIPEGSYVDPSGRERQLAERWVDEFELRWPVYQYGVLPNPSGSVGALFTRQGSGWVRAGESDVLWPQHGVFVPKGFDSDDGACAIRVYRPLHDADMILKDVTKLRLDFAGLLEFINKWGRLGVGIAGSPQFLYDGVQLTLQRLKDLQGWIEWYSAYGARPAKAPKGTAYDFLVTVGHALQGVQPHARLDRAGFEPMHLVPSLYAALFLQLLTHVTKHDRFSRCPRCEGLFFLTRLDRKFCSSTCKTAMNVRRFRQRKAEGKRKGSLRT